jgi:hypothetical protein
VQPVYFEIDSFAQLAQAIRDDLPARFDLAA